MNEYPKGIDRFLLETGTLLAHPALWAGIGLVAGFFLAFVSLAHGESTTAFKLATGAVLATSPLLMLWATIETTRKLRAMKRAGRGHRQD